MKKLFLLILILAMLICSFSGCTSKDSPATEPSSESLAEVSTIPPTTSEALTEVPTTEAPTELSTEPTGGSRPPYHVAMVSTGYTHILYDETFDSRFYNAAKTWCEEHGIEFTYYKAPNTSEEERISTIEHAILEGYNVLLLRGFSFEDAIAETAESYPDVYFIGIDVAGDTPPTSLPANVYCVTYQEEVSAFLAGYAAVKLGCSDLAVLGDVATPSTIRHMYGFMQGADYAAKESGTTASLKYGYVYQCFGGTDSLKYSYAYTSFCDKAPFDAAKKLAQWTQEGLDAFYFYNLDPIPAILLSEITGQFPKIIPSVRDLRYYFDNMYGEGTTLTSAMESHDVTIAYSLSMLIVENRWEEIGGTVQRLGLVSSEDLTLNHVGLPESTQWNDSFTREDYAAIVQDLLTGTVQVSNNIEAPPAVESISIEAVTVHLDEE